MLFDGRGGGKLEEVLVLGHLLDQRQRHFLGLGVHLQQIDVDAVLTHLVCVLFDGRLKKSSFQLCKSYAER